jgi:hypothetical protein
MRINNNIPCKGNAVGTTIKENVVRMRASTCRHLDVSEQRLRNRKTWCVDHHFQSHVIIQSQSAFSRNNQSINNALTYLCLSLIPTPLILIV